MDRMSLSWIGGLLLALLAVVMIVVGNNPLPVALTFLLVGIALIALGRRPTE